MKYFKNINKYLILIIMLFIAALNFNLLMKPINFVTGGTPGFSIIISNWLNISPEYVIYFIYLLMFIISYIFLGKESILGLLIASILYPLFVTLTGNVTKYITISYNDFLLISIFSGIISGFSNGFIYKYGFSSSGLGVLGPVFNKCFHLSIASTNFFVNTIIVIAGGYSFGINMILYAIVFLYLSKFVSNKIILGISSNKILLLRSNKLKEINNMLYFNYKIDGINIKMKDCNNNLALILVPTLKYNIILKSIKKIDKYLFYDVLDSYEVSNFND